MIDRGLLASYSLSSLSKITNPENNSQLKLAKDPSPNRVNGLFLFITIPDTLYNNLLTFRDTDKKFELHGDLLKMKPYKNFNVDLAKLSNRKEYLILQKECSWISVRHRSLIELVNSPATIASGISTMFLPENPNEHL